MPCSVHNCVAMCSVVLALRHTVPYFTVLSAVCVQVREGLKFT